MSLNQRFGYLLGAVYVLVGLVGFAVTGGVGFAAAHGKDLVVFMINPLHNLVHLGVGALLIAGALAGAAVSQRVNLLIGAVYLAVGVVGLFILHSSLNLLALNMPDNGLHFASAIAALAVGLTGVRAAGGTARSESYSAAR
jgi:hypothetical protein